MILRTVSSIIDGSVSASLASVPAANRLPPAPMIDSGKPPSLRRARCRLRQIILLSRARLSVTSISIEMLVQTRA